MTKPEARIGADPDVFGLWVSFVIRHSVGRSVRETIPPVIRVAAVVLECENAKVIGKHG